MSQIKMVGKQSLEFQDSPWIIESGNVVGRMEGDGPLGKYFDMVGEDEMFGCENWESAEGELQKEALTLALGKAEVKANQVRYLFAGDLLGQNMASSFGLEDMNIPIFGLYGACSTAGESLSLASLMVAAGAADLTAAVTSSHFASAEKQFRFPLAYGNQRPPSSTWTVTGSGAFLVGHKKGIAKVTGITTGKIVDYGVKDTMNMGGCMAPAAVDTIYANLTDFHRPVDYYDKIITGDLGEIGVEILIDLLKEKGYDIKSRILDCGMLMFDKEKQGTNAGGSGCGCSATILSAFILKQIKEGIWKRVLFVPTGALMSPVSHNEGMSVPGIAHAVCLEGDI